MPKKKYFTEEEKKAAMREANRLYYQRHRERIIESVAEYRQNNKEKIAEHKAEYYQNNIDYFAKYRNDTRSTPLGRANYLLDNYRRADKDANRGECTLTAEWIVEHIFTQPCAHCGKAGWKIIGCNRLDNSLPHTPDNVEPCCWECNTKLEIERQKKAVYQYTKKGELIATWDSVNECGRNGFCAPSVSQCCNGIRKSHNGYLWSYFPL